MSALFRLTLAYDRLLSKLIFNCYFTRECERSNRVNTVVLGSQVQYFANSENVSEDRDDAV